MTFTIIVAGANVGLQTDARVDRMWWSGPVLDTIDVIVLYIFTFEILVKILSCKFRPLTYFHDRWNVFDFLIVAASYIPGAGSSLKLMRLLRLMRLLKLIKRMPQLNVIISSIFIGLGSIGYVSVIIFLVLYCFAILGVFLFGDGDPWYAHILPYIIYASIYCK